MLNECIGSITKFFGRYSTDLVEERYRHTSQAASIPAVARATCDSNKQHTEQRNSTFTRVLIGHVRSGDSYIACAHRFSHILLRTIAMLTKVELQILIET